MPKFNAYTAATSIADTDIFIKDNSSATATRKVTGTVLADYVGSRIAEDDDYEGVSLATKFSAEITAQGGGDVWAWIKWRITNGNFTGIHVGDYIPIALSGAGNRQARILGINTYKQTGSSALGNHIDFFAGRWGTTKAINPVNYNNGTAESDHPWLASDAYLFANSLAGRVPNSASDGSVLTSVDYTSGGIYSTLPTALKDVIVPKNLYLEKRYTAGSLLTDSNGWAWASLGNVWFPTEAEINGFPVWGTPGYSSGGSVQYPYFRSWKNRLSIGRYFLQTLTPKGGDSTNWAVAGGTGYAGNSQAGYASGFYYPICFRVA